ncbi:MAG: hypothetical protein V4507_08735 [Verrucomicrobiota bacterium]
MSTHIRSIIYGALFLLPAILLQASPKQEDLASGPHLGIGLTRAEGFVAGVSIDDVVISGAAVLEASRGDESQMGSEDCIYKQFYPPRDVSVVSVDPTTIQAGGFLTTKTKNAETLKFETTIKAVPEKERFLVHASLTPQKDGPWTYPGGFIISFPIAYLKDKTVKMIDLKGKETVVPVEKAFDQSFFGQTLICPTFGGEIIFDAEEGSKLTLQDFRSAENNSIYFRISKVTDVNWKRVQLLTFSDHTEIGYSVTFRH